MRPVPYASEDGGDLHQMFLDTPECARITVIRARPRTRPSAMVEGPSDLERRLEDAGRDTLVITGTLTNGCCESAARGAAAPGFHNLMVSGATAIRSDIEHNAALVILMRLVADVHTTAGVLAMPEPHLTAA